MTTLQPGNWIKVLHASSGIAYWHHGIVSSVEPSGVKIIHFRRQQQRIITETSLAQFLDGGSDAQVVDEEPAFQFAEVVRRARKHLGRKCCHFVARCYKGRSAFSKNIFAFGAGAGAVSVVFGALTGIFTRRTASPVR
jgi:hypothetical protein